MQQHGIYEKPGVKQESDHILGAVQETIRGRIRFALIGFIVVCTALLGLYMLWIAKVDVGEYTESTKNLLVATLILIYAVGHGLRIISYITYRVKLRRTGFEICSIFGTKPYLYQDVSFNISRILEHKYESEGYRPVLNRTENLNKIWVCRITVRDSREQIVLKSSRYAWLYNKMQNLMSALARQDESQMTE